MTNTVLNLLIIPNVMFIVIAGLLLLRRRDIFERLMIADLISMLLIGLIILIGVQEEREFLIDIALILATLSFIATVTFARIITYNRGRQRGNTP